MNAGQLYPREPIAVVGMACRAPGARDLQDFWRLLRSGEDAISAVPSDRWDTGTAPQNARFGGFVDDVAGFDAEFFGISPREAAAMDPQQRLVLELSWTALEDAGIVPATLAGRNVGVFVGALRDDYAILSHTDESTISGTTMTGTQRAVIANRVSYTLGLRGPSMTVDTAQSSSLVAVHLAATSVRAGESELAIAAGVNLNLLRAGAVTASRFGGLSDDGRCFTFDERANGFVRGEGAGVVVLKPLERALADGDLVHCVLLGGAVNNDGSTDGLTVPSAEAQAEVVRAACADAGVAPTGLQYVELHGSGTPVGDPLEATALGAVRAGAEPLLVGSVKTNIGHLEGAGGILGLIKTALSLEHGVIPPSLNHDRPNPAIPLTELGLRVVTTTELWPEADARLAGVSSFGMGGTNCHVVLASAPTPAPPGQSDEQIDAVPVLLSGRTEQALRVQASQLASFLDATPDVSLADIARAAATTRTSFRNRAVTIAATREDLLRSLHSVADGLPDGRTVEGQARTPGRTVFVFPGQGSQWGGMAAALLESSPVFRARIDECARALAPFTDWSLHDVLRDGEGLDRVDVVQPALFAVMVSLAALWQSLGVCPDAVVGHSQGEIAAACVAGALTLEDAAKIVALRSHALTVLAGTGTMAVVALPEAEVRSRLTERLEVAALNSPTSTVVCGPIEDVEAFVAACRHEGDRARRIDVDYASHCAAVEAVREQLLHDLSDITAREPRIAFYSTVTGELVSRALDAGYWYDNLRRPVLLAPTVATLLDEGHSVFVEISPHPVLTGAVAETAEAVGAEPVVAETLRRDDGGWVRVLSSAASLHTNGIAVDWQQALPSGARLRLPTYPFQRRPFWLQNSGDRPAPSAPATVMVEHDEVVPEKPSTNGRQLLRLVQAHTAIVLGHADAAAVDPDLTFKEMGLDSRMAVELRGRLNDATGAKLPSGAVYDHPSPSQLADALRVRLSGDSAPATTAPVTAKAQDDDPVAIVAMACRLPGADSPEQLWQLLIEGADLTSELPDDRGWNLDHPVRIATARGGFLHGAGNFDAELFGISPREATAMDPQQRLLLELAWEVFERAGLDASSLRGSRTGVFAGMMAQDYGPRMHAPSEELAGHLLTGGAASVASGRISYTFGLRGPAITLDTACSSSLVAVHTAARSIQAGECTLALAGGATVMATPGMFVEFEKQGGLAPDGRCKPFSANADGTAWGEGAGLLLLERLSEARRNGHPVLAVLRGSAINSDGASNGLTAPNGRAQVEVVREALSAAGLSASDVDVVEAHGTGTVLGDPIEAQALLETYGGARSAENPVWLGSLKSNIGHAQAAAGVAGMIKMVLAMRNGVLPQTLHASESTGHVDWSSGALRLLDEAKSWPAGASPRRAAVSAFGISGTNAHVIIEEADAAPAVSVVDAPAITAWPVSAATPAALQAQATQLHEFASRRTDLSPAVIGAALAHNRTALRERAVVLGEGTTELLSALTALGSGQPADDVVRGHTTTGSTAFLFSGQGSQRIGMGVALAEAYPVFADALKECFAHLDPELPRIIAEDPDRLNQTEFAQPALFAVEVALHRLLDDWGVTPDFLAGHSIGEIAVAHVAGVLSLPDACRLVTARGRLMQALPTGGVMVAVRAAEADVAPLLDGDVAIAAINGPESLVLSGAEDAVLAVARHFGSTKRLAVSHAFHSPLMTPMLDEFRRVASELTYSPARVPIVSTVTGQLITEDDLRSAEYWVRHAANAVRFHDAVTTLAAEGVRTFLELGPDAVLTALGSAGLASADECLFAPLLRRGRPEARTVVAALAVAHVRGLEVDWARVCGVARTPSIDLPTYPFQRERYWAEAVQQSAAVPATRDWRYRVAWNSLPAVSPARPAGTWLLVAHLGHGQAWVRALAAGLIACGARVHQLLVDDHHDLAARLRAIGRVDGTISLLGLAEHQESGVSTGLSSTLTLLNAVGDLHAPLWLLTEQAMGTSADDPVRNPVQAQVWGLGQVAALEQPESWGGLVDLPATPGAGAVDRLLAVLAGPAGEDQFAVRDADVLVRRVVPAPQLRQDPARRWRPEGTVLITGGTGALGAHLTRWLAAEGAEHVVLASRRGAAQEALHADLAAQGVRLTSAACDVTDSTAVKELIFSLAAEGHPVRTVVHAAGVNVTQPLTETSESDLATVLAAKVAGAQVVEDLLVTGQIEEAVLFSSAAGVWGGNGQGAYAAANACLDALADRLRSQGHRATSVAWGMWAGDGMGADDTLATKLGRSGMRALAPELALQALHEALSADESALTVADLDRDKFASLFSSARERRLFDEFVVTSEVDSAGDVTLRQELAALPADKRRGRLLDLVKSEAAAVRGQNDPQAIPSDQALRDLGFDSLMSVELRTRLAAATGLTLSRTLVFEHPNAEALARHLHEELRGEDEDVLAVLNRLEPAMTADPDLLPDVIEHLQGLLARLGGREPASPGIELDGATDEELFDLIDGELRFDSSANGRVSEEEPGGL
ncbi:type I polyketide synthase PikAI [Lentzea xinjiangensis]|uniref:6-deoxyerythronolide-B synthase n=1 Tax=Lentzea xinjiangensis TaxID=402600 RepID=A0A1H9WF99_9PSEU|nr:type I polyketide synthase [Lentzea xinjiangensis]SES32606.1 type I polyketide synthase PikAI [Lentzea xinjiangensis]